MPIQNSGWISMQDISNEFGRGNGTMLISDYYRGKPRVPNSPKNTKIPMNGTIWLSDFYGASSVVSGQYNPRALGWSNFTWPNFDYMEVFVYGAGGGGGGGSQIFENRMLSEAFWRVEASDAGTMGAAGGNSIFACNGFNIVATGGAGGYASGWYEGENGGATANGYGSNGDVNISGHEWVGGGAGGTSAGKFIYFRGERWWTTYGGKGGNGGYSKRAFSRNGYGSHITGTNTSIHIGAGGAGGRNGAVNGAHSYAGQGANGFIDVYWS